ncbi:MAG: hypothetical protein JSR54_08025 [Proteobacteria bacterium]|nr:hypothetical protein [Pseudomonadota bacterium]
MREPEGTSRAPRRVWNALPALLLAAALAACGGGYGGQGSSYTPPAQSAGPAGVAIGAITGFGSVHLNGKKFETTSATISIDGKAATQSDLQVGDVIEVKSHHDSASGKDVADTIEMHSNVLGPVDAVDTAAQSLRVLGQAIAVSADTSFGSGISPASLAGVAVGDVLRVSGMTGADGTIHATRIERAPSGAVFHVIGTAAATDVAARTLKINALVVDFSAATLVDFPSSGPQDGDLVEADGSSLDAAGEFKATRLERRNGKDLKADADGEAEVEGIVTRFASTSDFDVAGTSVVASASTSFEGGSASDLALNVRVEVEGTVNASGVLNATRIRIEHPSTVRLVAQVDAVDAAGGTVTLLGTTVSVTAMTRFEDHSAANLSTFSLTDVHTGDWLEIRGSQSPAGSNTVVAARLERRDPAAQVLLSGTVATATAPDFGILAVHVATTPATQFVDATGQSTDATTFFLGLVGQQAVALGGWDGTTLTAARALLGAEGENGETEDH